MYLRLLAGSVVKMFYSNYFRDDSTVVMSDAPRPGSMADDSPPPAVSIRYYDKGYIKICRMKREMHMYWLLMIQRSS